MNKLKLKQEVDHNVKSLHIGQKFQSMAKAKGIPIAEQATWFECTIDAINKKYKVDNWRIADVIIAATRLGVPFSYFLGETYQGQKNNEPESSTTKFYAEKIQLLEKINNMLEEQLVEYKRVKKIHDPTDGSNKTDKTDKS